MKIEVGFPYVNGVAQLDQGCLWTITDPGHLVASTDANGMTHLAPAVVAEGRARTWDAALKAAGAAAMDIARRQLALFMVADLAPAAPPHPQHAPARQNVPQPRTERPTRPEAVALVEAAPPTPLASAPDGMPPLLADAPRRFQPAHVHKRRTLAEAMQAADAALAAEIGQPPETALTQVQRIA